MALVDEIRSLRDRVSNDLNAAHDYYEHTKLVWIAYQGFVEKGLVSTYKNLATGNIIDQDELYDRAPIYIAGPLIEASFQQFIAIFESFLFDLLHLWMTAHPRSLGKRPVDLRTILEAADREGDHRGGGAEGIE